MLDYSSTIMLTFREETGAESLVDRYAHFMRLCINSAWNDWITSIYPVQMQSKSFRAQFVNNQIIYHARHHAAELTDVSVDRLGGNYGLILANQIFVRPKFARNGYRSSNYPTKAALAFHDQSVDLFGGIARLELLYTLNQLETAVQDICLTQRHQKQIQWLIPLVDQTAESGQESLAVLPAREPIGRPADRIIKTKRTSENQNGVDAKRGNGTI
jgi:hypothetical protein